MNSSHHGRMIFSHGLDSGPRSPKNEYLRPIAEHLGWQTEAVDDRDIQSDPAQRVDRLVEGIQQCRYPPVLVGSSLGGYVSVLAAERVLVAGLWLMAPALFLEDRYKDADPPVQVRDCYQPLTENICVVHGWNDDTIPWQHSVRFAKQHQAELHLLNADHRFAGVLPELGALLTNYLKRF